VNVARSALIVGPFAVVVAAIAALTSPGAGDFFQFWYAGHLVAIGSSPYDQAEWVNAYARYGDLASVVRQNCPAADAPACRWVYPPWTGWLLVPFGIVASPLAGIALESAAFLAILAAGVFVAVRAARIGPDWLRALTLVAFALSAPFVTDAFGGHFDGLLLIGLSLSAASLATRRALALAIAAPLLALKPHLFIAFGPLVLAWVLRERQSRLIWMPAAVVAALVVAGLASDPRALPALTTAGTKLALVGSTTWSLASRAGPLAPVVAGLLVALAALAAAAALRWARPEQRAQVFVAATAAFSLVVAPYVQLYDHLLLFPALALAVSFASAAGRSAAALAVLVAFIAAGWGAHALEQQGRTFAGLIPVAVLIVLAVASRGTRDAGAGVS